MQKKLIIHKLTHLSGQFYRMKSLDTTDIYNKQKSSLTTNSKSEIMFFKNNHTNVVNHSSILI